VRPGVSGAVSGAIIGFAVVFLLQQLGVLSLSDLVPGLTYFLAAVLAAAVVFGIGGWLLGRSAVRRARKILAEEGTKGGSGPPGATSDSKADAPKST
jgi:hypothetical protein